MTYDLARVVRDAWNVVQNSITPAQREHRQTIFDRFSALVTMFGQGKLSEPEFHERVCNDFELFCVAYVRLDDMKPMFPAIWQSQAAEIAEKHEENLFILARKTGKTSLETAYALWKAISTPATRVVIFAPTEDQLFAMQDILKALRRNPYLIDRYVQPGSTGHIGGKLSEGDVLFYHNWSEIVAMNLAQKQIAATKRGQKGGVIIVDEIGLVLKDVRTTVIDDMMADSYTEKKMLMWGTPDKLANPELETEWMQAQQDPDIGTLHIDIWEGVRQGCIRPKYVRRRFKKLFIPCPWGAFKGCCGKRDFPGQPYPDPGGPWDGWQCNECCMLSEAFVVENMGEFPQLAGRFFPKTYLEAAAVADYAVNTPNPQPGHEYVMGLDLGLLMNPVQATVWDVVNGSIVLNYWLDIPPVEAEQRGGQRNYDPIIRRVKEVYRSYGLGSQNQIRRIYADATAAGLQVVSDMTTGPNPIPPSKFFQNETSKAKQVTGIWFSGPYKHMTMQNYRTCILAGRVKVSRREPYYTKFMTEHENVLVTPVESNSYLKFQEPRGGSIDLMDSQAMAALELSDEMKGLGSYLGYVTYTKTERAKPKTGEVLILRA